MANKNLQQTSQVIRMIRDVTYILRNIEFLSRKIVKSNKNK